MSKFFKYTLSIILLLGFWSIVRPTVASVYHNDSIHIPPILPPDSTGTDTSNLAFPFTNPLDKPVTKPAHESPLMMETPDNVHTDVEYNPETNEYEIVRKVGDTPIGTPTNMSFEEYKDYEFNQSIRKYWNQRARSETFEHNTSLVPQLHIGSDVFDKIFGSDVISIKPQGSAELIFGMKINRTDNPALPERLRKTSTFDFQEKIQMNVTGKIGDKLTLSANYDTEATFDFENKMKIGYQGKEDEIIQVIEAGDVTLPLTGSLITGSQSLFGFKAGLKFGNLTVTSIFSQEKGQKQVINVENGAQTEEFEIYAADYEANKHFFLAHFFRDRYDMSLENLPLIQSGIQIKKIEVWVTNKASNFQNSRNIIAFLDMGEADPNKIQNSWVAEPINIFNSPNAPVDSSNNILRDLDRIYGSDIRDINNSSQLENHFNIGTDYEKIENARLLTQSEYSVSYELGYISLNSALNSDEVLGVAFEYTYNGETFRVGNFSNSVQAPSALFIKLLKGTTLTPALKNWDLMMKNIYAIGAYQVDRDNFLLDVMYKSDKTGAPVNYLDEGNIEGDILLNVMGLDKVNSNLDQAADGVFDFIPNVTIKPQNGRVIFPSVEPFGSYLRKQITGGNPLLDDIADKYVYQELYDSTQTKAIQIASKNKFFLWGNYQSSSGSEISLNALNVPEGSVTVSANGMQLQEGVDYSVDYTLGRVKILNSGLLESGTPIQISLESHSLFSIQNKTLMGSHLDYKVNDKLNLGATIMNLTEKPLTQKVNMGDEPISNTIWGADAMYRNAAPIITKLVDLLPFISTKAPSNVTFSGEFAQLIPGHPKVIGETGTSYIDDFESSETSLDIKSFHAWKLASIPSDYSMFPENDTSYANALESGFNRAKLAWYTVDPVLTRNEAGTPQNLKNSDEMYNHFVREVYEQEIFKNKESQNSIPTNIAVLNLAYYPKEKGPYNFDATGQSGVSAGVNPDGTLKSPESRWAGVQREIQSSDFEASNIELIELWMMDPYVYDDTHPGGDMYFNLGNVSEDVLKDSRKSFEDGLPSTEVIEDVDTTAWGLVPIKQSLSNSFAGTGRIFQDVGYDGLNDDNEKTFFSNYINELASIGVATPTDPASDNYHHFRGDDYDAQELDILSRYKDYNGSEGNSPEGDNEDYSTAASAIPNSEDINNDNTLSETESYYQYHISLHRQDMHIGKNFITDIVVGENEKGEQVNWYQFKIPVKNPEKIVGNISDFKSIRFMRMFLKNFNKEVVLRFARIDLVREEWRKYTSTLRQASISQATEIDNTNFSVSAVNIEENGDKAPVNYILPPNITRVIDPTNPQLRQLNEQAMAEYVCDLDDGDARAAFKTMKLDVRKYKRIVMDVHAEDIVSGSLKDNDLTAFIRIGSDFSDNYYEYEVPLKVTPAGAYSNESESDRLIVWPEVNQFNFLFDELTQIKLNRNKFIREGGQIDITKIYKQRVGRNTIYVKGNPNIANIKTIMLGIRNRGQGTNDLPDDGMSKCGVVWFNELRLTEFDEKGGWAAQGRLQIQLADFGSISLAGLTSTAGFGSIEKRVDERSMEDLYQYDLSTNLQLGKFFGEKAQVSVPMYVGYSEQFINPQYDPLDPDITFDRMKESDAISEEDKAERIEIAQDYTKRKSINFTNVKINKRSGKPKPYDLANFGVSYSYSKIERRNVNEEYNNEKKYRGAFTYNYSSAPKNYKPFSKVKAFRNKNFRLLRDFNFYLMPKQFSFLTDMNRRYSERKLRNINRGTGFRITPTYDKDFMWNRMYNLKWDFAKSLKLDFKATNNARIDEPQGIVNKDDETYEQWKDSVMINIMDFGRNTHYGHTLKLTYALPINKIPYLNWLSANAQYSTTYDWNAGPLLRNESTDKMYNNLGNDIKNSRNFNGSSSANMINLYNNVPYLKYINKKYRRRGRVNKRKKDKEKVFYPDKKEADVFMSFKKDKPKSIKHNLKTVDVTLKIIDDKGKEVKGKTVIVSENKITFEAERTVKAAKINIEGLREKKDGILKLILENTVSILMGVKNISVNYQLTEGTILPGYMNNTNILGASPNFEAPGFGFLFGEQDDYFGLRAANNGWITKEDTLLNKPYIMTSSETFSVRSTIEPIKGMKIDLSANRTFAVSSTRYINYNYYGNNEYTYNNEIRNGNFTMSFNTWNTAFQSTDDKYNSKAFNDFKSNRLIIANRLAEDRRGINGYNPDLNRDADGYPDGYGKLSQDVIMPAFLAAYSGSDPTKSDVSKFPSIWKIRPNWRISYDGISRIRFIKQYFKKVTLNHSYRSSYNITSFQSDTRFDVIPGNDGFTEIRDELNNNNFIPEYEIGAVSITESFSPLINIDMSWKNSFSTKFEIKKNRNLTYSFANNQLTELKGNEYIIGMGYRIPKVKFKIGKNDLESDLDLRGDLSIRDNYTIIRKLEEEYNQITSGTNIITIKISIDYRLGKRLNLRLFYDRIVNNPKISRTFPTKNTNFGLSLRFSLNG